MTSILSQEHQDLLKNTAYECLVSLSTEEGIYASSKEEAYGCIFGRDSAITILKLLNVYEKNPNRTLIDICKRTLFSLIGLQGKVCNFESGEEPGKFIHEFRKSNYERLINREKPWYVYPDGALRNYDSIDSTPLILIAIYKYWEIVRDDSFTNTFQESIKKGLRWILEYGDKDGDFLLEYELPEKRIHGGLVVQSWTDSYHSLVRPDGTFPSYPIAPVEVQAISWLALKLWSDYFEHCDRKLSIRLKTFAEKMKKSFSNNFIISDTSLRFAAQALDGRKNKIETITSNPLICLWATYTNLNKKESIVEDSLIDDFVRRAFLADLFDKDAGMRTMSVFSPTFDSSKSSYHNGSFWPMLNGLIHEGLKTWGYDEYAQNLMDATLKPIHHFGFPIELYIKDEDGNYLEYETLSGRKGCRYQAWSAAATLDLLTEKIIESN